MPEGTVGEGLIEFFGVYSADTGKCYLVPVDVVPVGGARLRLTKSRNNQEKGIRWAKEFEI
jgi:PD-(D/E)XK endonuclease